MESNTSIRKRSSRGSSRIRDRTSNLRSYQYEQAQNRAVHSKMSEERSENQSRRAASSENAVFGSAHSEFQLVLIQHV